uniref:Uncharacterized protein n=1 Tax=Anguilla anguilla TaxID=7936 RepID=A0A0E9UCX1_ANGAN
MMSTCACSTVDSGASARARRGTGS